MTADERLVSERFPRSSTYHPEWVIAGASGGANALWLAEALTLRAGAQVLDLGCGLAMSSVFLRREFGVQVWATDLWFSASKNLQRVRDASVEDGVFPIHADARSLPFATAFFDAVVCIDSFPYYGTDDLYLNYLARFVKPGGVVGVAGRRRSWTSRSCPSPASMRRNRYSAPRTNHAFHECVADRWCSREACGSHGRGVTPDAPALRARSR